MNVGNYSNAVESYEAALRLSPGHAENHFWLGWAHIQLAKGYVANKQPSKSRNNQSKATEHFRQASKLDPKGKIGKEAGRLYSILSSGVPNPLTGIVEPFPVR